MFLEDSKVKRFFYGILGLGVKALATNLFACGHDTAVSIWGNREWNLGRIHIMPNAIETNNYRYSIEKRSIMRKNLGIGNQYVIGNVSRFTYAKNHEFMLEVLCSALKIDPNVVLVLAGDGELFEDVKNKAESKNLSNNILFLGARSDVAEILNVFDVFILPSRFEGLPVVMIEAQANGLPVLVSNTVTKEVNLSANIRYLSVEGNSEEWAKKAIQAERVFDVNGDLNRLYDINAAAQNLLCFYNEQLNKK
jgi:glycosyltransferase involved in cell wall biosynthesis